MEGVSELELGCRDFEGYMRRVESTIFCHTLSLRVNHKKDVDGYRITFRKSIVSTDEFELLERIKQMYNPASVCIYGVNCYTLVEVSMLWPEWHLVDLLKREL